MGLYGRNTALGWGDMKGAGQALKARLIPLRANRGPVFPHHAVLSGGEKFIYHQVKDITKMHVEGSD